jgi:hypothetical protein
MANNENRFIKPSIWGKKISKYSKVFFNQKTTD